MTLEFCFNFSSANSRNLKGMIFRDHYFTCYGFHDEFNIMILFYDKYVSVFRRKSKEMYEISFVETSSIVDETDISINVSIGGNAEGTHGRNFSTKLGGDLDHDFSKIV